MKRLLCMVLALSLPAIAAAQQDQAAPLGLGPPESETTEASVAADSFAIVRLMAIMELSDQQVMQISARLTALAETKTEADVAQNQALLQMREALAQKARALASGAEVPQAAQRQIDQGMLAIVRSRAELKRAELDAYSTFIDTLRPDQILMIEWDLAGPGGAQVEAMLNAYAAQANQTLNAITQLMWRPMAELMTIGANLYLDRRLALINDLMNVGADPRLHHRYSMEEEQIVRNLIDVFDGWRTQMINDFGGAPPEQALREVAPMIAADALMAMGIEVPSAELPPPLISESELRRLLLRPETAELIAQRAEYIRATGGAGGAMGVPPGGWGAPPPNMGGGPMGPGGM
ncbi:MAG: hypothetical protein GF320_04550 [Armatimonadia bacterium]|nr:hypothetical protein [Armatimonadia bacterium]